MKSLKILILIKKLNKTISACILALCVIAISVVVLILNSAKWVNAEEIIIKENISFNGVIYGEENPFTILEVLPDVSLTELSYEVRDTWWDDKSIQILDINEGKSTNIATADLAALTSTTNWAVISLDSNKVVHNNDLFLNAVFSEEEIKLLRGKIVVKPKSARDLELSDIEDADMIYVNTGCHTGNTSRASNNTDKGQNLTLLYQAYATGSLYTCPVNNDGKYVTFSDTVNGESYDMSWEMAWEIYMATKVNGKPLIYDQKAFNDQTTSSSKIASTNAYKLGFLIRCLPGDKFVELYASTKNADKSLTGSEGCRISSTGAFTGTTYNNNTYNNKAVWDDNYMFVPSSIKEPWEDENLAAFGYVRPAAAVNYLKDNIFVFPGTNALDQALSANTSKDEPFGDIIVTDFSKVPGVTNGSVIRFILGDFESPEVPIDSKIKVLEIQPTGNYEYTDCDGALLALKYLGYSTNGYTESKAVSDAHSELRYWGDYVEFTSISSNGFNGMNKDLVATYDLIIVGTNHDTLKIDYNDSKDGQIYRKIGDLVTVKNAGTIQARFSGNDISTKALKAIQKYVNAGMPLILADEIYMKNTSAIDSDSNIIKLGDLGTSVNVVSISEAKDMHDSQSMSFRGNNANNIFGKKPIVNVSSPINSSSITSFNQFVGTIKGEPNTQYDIKIIIDKNCDGLFDDVSEGDSKEIVNELKEYSVTTDANGNAAYSVTIHMATNARGYFGWNVVVTKSESLLRGINEGSFILLGSEKTVKVLQIIPVNSVITLNLSDKDFTNLFSDVHNITNLTLQVNVMTTRQVEAWYDKKSKIYGTDDIGNYSMVVIGYSDDYGLDDLSGGALEALIKYNDEKKSILFTHDTMSYSASTKVAGVFTKSAAKNLTNAFRSKIGMQRFDENVSMGYSSMMLSKYANYTMFKNIEASGSMKTTSQVTQLNAGQVTQYPYKISSTIDIAETHAQYYQLDLEEKFLDGIELKSSEAVVWYTLSGDNNFYDQSGQDAVNNYYIYSIGNITYSGAGHSTEDTDAEKKLFVNTIIKAIASGNSVPEIAINNAAISKKGEYVLNISEMDIDTLKIKYTATDNDLYLPTDQGDRTGGKLISGKVYWDVNCNKVYDLEDKILVTYDSDNILYNAITNELPILSSFLQTDSNGDKIKTYLQNNELIMLGFEATDSLNVTGTASLSIVKRKLFNLN